MSKKNNSDSAVVKKTGPGAPVKFDAAAREKFITGIRSSAMSIKTAAAFAGVSDDTVMNHRKRDPKFAAEVDRALEEFKAQSQIIIAHAGSTHWQARAWMLERRFPAEFARAPKDDAAGAEVRIVIEGGLPRRS